MDKLFTDRQGGIPPRTSEVLNAATRIGLLSLVSARIREESFGLDFPDRCGDGFPYAGTDISALRNRLALYGVIWPGDIDPESPPADSAIFDLIEIAYEFVAEPTIISYHSYLGHSHYSYDREAGRISFSRDVNRAFERNGIAFELRDGMVTRLAPAVLDESLALAHFHSGDATLDALLGTARSKFLDRSLTVRREAVEKLWDAWERLKTLEPGKDKKARATTLLDVAATEAIFRAQLERESHELTKIGNTFMIRHTETDKVPLVDSHQVDYLFHRMFAMIMLLLHATGRGK